MNNDRIEAIIFYFLSAIIFLNLIFPGEIYSTSRYLALLVSITLCFLLSLNRLQQKAPLNITLPYKGLFVAIIILLMVSSFASINYQQSRDYLFLFLSYALIFLMVHNIEINNRMFDNFCKGILIVGLLIAGYGIYQYLFGFDYLLKELPSFKDLDQLQRIDIIKRIGEKRIFSTFALPTSLSGFLALIIPLAAAKSYLSCRHNKKLLLLYLPLISLYLVAMIATGSFGAIISLLLAAFLAFQLLSLYKGKIAKSLILYILALVVILGLSLLTLGYLRGFQLWNLKASTNPIILRWENWKVALKIAQDFPFLGAGLGNYGTLYPKYMTLERSKTQFAHNSLLQFAAEIGFIATIMMAVMVFLLFRNSIRHIRRGLRLKAMKEEDIIKYALLVSCLTFAIHNLLEISLYFPSLGLLGIFLFSLLLRMGDHKAAEERRNKALSHSYRIILVWIVLLLFLFAVIWITRPMMGKIYAQRAEEATIKEDYHNALRFISSAIFWDSKNCEYYSTRAKMVAAIPEEKGGDFEALVKDYKEALRCNPYSPHLHFELSQIYLSRGWLASAYLETYEAKRLYPLNKKYAEHLENCQQLMMKARANDEVK